MASSSDFVFGVACASEDFCAHWLGAPTAIDTKMTAKRKPSLRNNRPSLMVLLSDAAMLRVPCHKIKVGTSGPRDLETPGSLAHFSLAADRRSTTLDLDHQSRRAPLGFFPRTVFF